MDELLQAIEAIKADDKPKAQRLLALALKKEPNNELAWLWMSRVVDDPQKEQMCLQKVLRINPNNRSAKLLLRYHDDSLPEESVDVGETSMSVPAMDGTAPAPGLQQPEVSTPVSLPQPEPLRPEEPIHTQQTQYCSNCGAPVAGNFCSNCGQPVHQAPLTPVQPQPNPPIQVIYTPPPSPPVIVHPTSNAQPNDPPGYEAIMVQTPPHPPSRFTAKRTIAAIGLGLIILAGLLAWENSRQWYGILLGGYQYSSSMGLTTGPGILSTISAVIGLVLLLAVNKESSAHLLGSLAAIISGIMAFIFMSSTGNIDTMIFDWIEYSDSAGVGIYLVFVGAAITLGCFFIPSAKKS